MDGRVGGFASSLGTRSEGRKAGGIERPDPQQGVRAPAPTESEPCVPQVQ